MRRFLTLICLLGLALPAGISISGCTRNPDGKLLQRSRLRPESHRRFSIILQPQIGGISLAYGQTLQVQSPSASTCQGAPASISTAVTNYGTTNNQLVDISPGGQLCAGTWNRNTGGGIADYTNCNYPNPLPSTGGLPYAVAYITATAYSVTSNPVAVYIHAPVTAINLVTSSLSSTSPQQCFSQNQVAVLDAQACYVAPNSSGLPTQYEFCAPPSVTRQLRMHGRPGAGRYLRSQLRIVHRHAQFLGLELQCREHQPRKPQPRNHTNPRPPSPRSSPAPLPSPQPSRNRHRRPATSPPARPRPSTSRWLAEAPRASLPRASRKTSPPRSSIRWAIPSMA